MKICIFGQMSNGKSTYAHMLQKHLNNLFIGYPGWMVTGWASNLKRVVCEKYNITPDFIEQWKRSEHNPPGFNVTMREVLQKEGQLGRDCKPDVWIDYVMKYHRLTNVIIDDGRYNNEARAITQSGGYNILIVRQGFLNDSTHPSESELKELINSIIGHGMMLPQSHKWFGLINTIINNSFGLEELEASAKETARRLFDKITTGV